MEIAAPGVAREWRVVAASVAGSRHERAGQPCQDAHLWRRLPDGVLVGAIADGAGSAVHAELGSATAVAAAVESVSRSVANNPPPEGDDDGWKALLSDALRAALAAVEKEAETRQVPSRDLATTLIVLVALRSLVGAAQIGDGAALVRSEDGNLIALSRPASGEHINETTFLVSPDAIDTAQVNLWRGHASGVAAFSDGLQMLALNMADKTPHPPFFSPLFRFVASITDADGAENQLKTFLRSSRIAQRTDDDLTLMLAALPD